MTEALANHTTFRLGGPARRFVEATTEKQLIDTVADCDSRGEPVLVLGGGSNVLIADEGFDGTVVKVATRGVRAEAADCSGAQLEVAAGETWDDLVARAVAAQWSGMETLSGIPGSVGAVPIQNVGAYGAEVATLIQRVRTWDRAEGAIRTFAAAECGFGYRDSRFKSEKGRHLVLRVDFQLPLGELGQPVRYPELARALGVEVGQRAPAARVRETVLAIRRRKGMVLDANDHDTWSAGSFFTNPILTPEQAASLPAEAPRFPAGEGVKTSAAWLIQHAGFPAGHGAGPARLSTRHVLALTNRGRATTADVLALAREIRDGVRERFGITLVPEVNLVGVSI
ncbi:UDP-N-acetylmuramate dehydrogenase [Arachnia propionica]|uniref:UDP-N-acetylmuramate dehydrogenase n=1 Tax=Arachnia propionica TaxID=1750 RepID=UPI000F6CA119|nr:UDP-N-acetylmuramate dehydrogenase [Arachnia propionica]VEJ59333.1 UDP-N-acetylenolpyruvoylglucosamine reductase [Arachnia propionica]